MPDGADLSRSRRLENRERLTADLMQPLRTGRLVLVALTPELARTALDDRPKLGRMLGARVPETWPGADFARMLPRIAEGVEEASPGAEPTRLVVHVADKTLIGETGFHRPPDGSGTVEVGYSIVPAYRGRELATEAARALIEASLQRPTYASSPPSASTTTPARSGCSRSSGCDGWVALVSRCTSNCWRDKARATPSGVLRTDRTKVQARNRASARCARFPLRAILSAQDCPRRRIAMNQQLLESIEREVLGWPGVEKDPDGSQVALYRFGRRQIGHVHRDGVADLPFPKAVHDELISDGLAEPHRGGFPAVVSYRVRGPEDVPGAVDLFRMSYERAKSAADRREGGRDR